jgi:hypothetical protein
MLSKAQAVLGAINDALKIWNFIVDLWISPEHFADDFAPTCAHLRAALDTLRLTLQISVGLQSVVSGSSLMRMGSNLTDPAIATTVNSEMVVTSEIKASMYRLRSLFIFWIKVQYLSREYAGVVDSGSQLFDLYLSSGPEMCTEFEEVLPLLAAAQNNLLAKANEQVSEEKLKLQEFKNTFYEAQRSTRKKKLRITNMGKDPEEERFELDQVVFHDRVRSMEKARDGHVVLLSAVKATMERFYSLQSASSRHLSTLRRAIADHLADTSRIYTDNNDLTNIIHNDTGFRSKCEGFIRELDKLVVVLRAKADKAMLFDTFVEKGNLLLFLNQITAAKTAYLEALDSLFNCLDSLNSWEAVCAAAISAPVDKLLLRYSVNALVVLGKVSKLCCGGDLETKSLCGRMAGELSQLPFKESLGHPQQGPFGFRCYICRSLGGPNSVFLGYDSISSASLVSSMLELINVLAAEELGLHALPLIVLLEHYHAVYTRRLDAWLLVRLLRVSILVDCHYFSEAVSMLAGIKVSLLAIQEGIFSEADYFTILESKLSNGSPKDFDTSSNGFDYNGIPPYLNNQPPQSDANKHCLAKLVPYLEELKTSLRQYVYEVPRPKEKGSPDAAAALQQQNPVQDSPAKDAKNSKTIKTPKTKVTEELERPAKAQVPVFSRLVELRIGFVLSKLEVELGALDMRILQGSDASLRALVANAEAAVGKYISELQTLSDDSTQALTLLIQCRMLSIKCVTTRYQFVDALAQSQSLLETLSSVASLSSNAAFECGNVWLKLKHGITDILLKKRKFEQAIKFTTTCIDGDANAVKSRYWTRLFILQRAVASSKLGKLSEAAADCELLIPGIASLKEDDVLVKALVLKASILRLRAFSVPGELMQDAIQLLRKALAIAMRIANRQGFCGADANMTFCNEESMIIQCDQSLPPLLSSFTTPRAAAAAFRCGPIDETDVYCTSIFANITLKSCRSLLNCYASLSSLLDEYLGSRKRPNDINHIKREILHTAEDGLKVCI